MIYAGIGNRDIPPEVFTWLEQIGVWLRSKNYLLRSGRAKGSDSAFEFGSRGYNEIFEAKDATPEAMRLASQFHNNWNACDMFAMKLHGRNSMIILGKNLDEPVKFVVCYAKDEEKGGTSLGIKMARNYNIPVFNLFRPEQYQELIDFVEKCN